MNNSSNDLAIAVNPTFPDSNTGIYIGGSIQLLKDKWYALVIERGLQHTPQITFSAGGTKNPIAHDHIKLQAGGAGTLTIGPAIFYSLVEIKGPKELDALSESKEVLQIFKVGEVKGVEKIFKDKITRIKTPIFGGYKIYDKKKKRKKKKTVKSVKKKLKKK